jgi:hypothetical protein
MIFLVCVPNSSKSNDKGPTYNMSLVFEMAAAAILENGRTLPILWFLHSACFSQYAYQISSKSGDK